MLVLKRGSVHRVRSSGRALLASAAVCFGLLEGCGARSAVDLIELSASGGAGPWNAGGHARAGGAGASSIAGAPAFGVAPAGMAGAPMTSPPPCEAVTIAIDELRPALTLVVDQSFSMGFHYPDNESPATRWSLVGDALFDPRIGVVKQFEASVRFGIAFFTGHSMSGGMCPILHQEPARVRNYDALNNLYRSLGPDGDTPTGEALQQIVTELAQSPTQGPRSILLVTDGNPDTCERPNPDLGQPEAVAAVQRAYAEGLNVYVLGISNGIADENLQQLANAGKGRPLNLVWGIDPDAAEPFQANGNVLGLAAQLGEILNRIPLCEVHLRRNVAASEVQNAHVLLDGQPLGYSSADGYVLSDPRRLAIVGKACEAIKAGGRQLSVRISCD